MIDNFQYANIVKIFIYIISVFFLRPSPYIHPHLQTAYFIGLVLFFIICSFSKFKKFHSSFHLSWGHFLFIPALLLSTIFSQFKLECPNHFFIMMLLSWSLVFLQFLPVPQQQIHLQKSLSLLLCATLFFPTLHKFTSPSFYSGEFFALEFMLGNIFYAKKFVDHSLSLLWPGLMDNFDYNRLIVHNFINAIPSTVSLNPPFPYFSQVITALVILTIFIELYLTTALITKSLQKSFHCFFLLLLWGICLFTMELAFLSIISFLAIFAFHQQTLKMKKIYLGHCLFFITTYLVIYFL